jgi:hypothetical protein
MSSPGITTYEIQVGDHVVYDDLATLINDHGAIVAATGSMLVAWNTGGSFVVFDVERYCPFSDHFGYREEMQTRYVGRLFDRTRFTTLDRAAQYARDILEGLDA